MLVLINPDNPSGNYILKEDVLKIAKWADDKGVIFVVDESFIDFVDVEANATFLNHDILDVYENLIVVKSISKSFGVPGLRLGVVASSNVDLIEYIKNDLSIWNINSFAEFYLQIFEKYKFDFEMGLTKFKQARNKFVKDLNEISGLRVIPSQANFIMCEVTGMNSRELAKLLLNDYNLFIKDLSNKQGCVDKSFIRIAVRNETENKVLTDALKEILS